jgi:beta-phosphoglucomutase
MLTISLKNYKAVIFDMDGTMIDNMSFHKKAWDAFCEKYGLELTEEEFKEKISGHKNDKVFDLLFNKKCTPEEIADYTQEKEALYRKLYEPEIHEISGLSATLAACKEFGIPVAVATTAPRANREFGFKKLNLPIEFTAILGDEDSKKGKPDPEIYLKTAQKLDVAPNECLVFEDSPPGVESAKAAGMTVIALLTSHTKEELADADYFIKDYTELVLTP